HTHFPAPPLPDIKPHPLHDALPISTQGGERNMSGMTFTPGPTPNTVRAADGRVLTAPEGWLLLPPGDAAMTRRVKAAGDHWVVRSEEHTSELQSLRHIVCRLLLEKR